MDGERNVSDTHLLTHSLWEAVTIATVSAVVSLITIVGNVLVMLSFKVNSQLKTVNNYYLLSLACADLIIGVFSMNLYTSYILMGRWALGSVACDLWLALDYVASNASVMNLLVISFDRYFSITRPLTYRAKRTPKRAGIMIGLAWLVSFVLWAPPILCWQYFVGKRTVPEGQCQIQFFSEPVITFGTAIAAFYVPVSVMTILYCRIYKETERRTKDLAELQGLNSSTNSDTQNCKTRSCLTSKDRSWTSKPAEEQLTNFSYASSEEEERSASPCVFKETRNKKCISYKFKDVRSTKSANGEEKPSSLSSAESVNAPSSSKPVEGTLKSQITKRKRMVLIKEKKAAQTLSAILLAFILTWTPYNIMVLVSTFCSDCVPLSLWHLGYWLCYVNSTVNPMCYALCNKTFQKTFRMLLLFHWRKKRSEEKLYWSGAKPAAGNTLS
ncbi:muscarinic acetylcholine receptor M5-like [Carassius auratus]|uniref:Muscarinic acetylcholine receptor n=1 Tax=Carassius auratus TaxID=7957 RepID=A0A6P6MWH6_CARAU|nr:muscarinic acetylcholine receptor M5-like [Carassius auratus]XP_026100729.1 muscarinic acetylcholine receptor M5-like [Carassius auratus]